MAHSSNYEHVIPSRRHLVEADLNVRKDAIAENFWINYPQAEKILAQVRFIVDLPRTGDGYCLVIHSQPGMGKSALFRRLMMEFGMTSGATDCLAQLEIDSERARDHKTFSNDLVSALTLGTVASYSGSKKRLLNAIGARNVRGIGIDEFNNLLATTPREQLKNLIQIKTISGPPYSLVVIIFGTSECREAIEHDTQFSRRFYDSELLPWKDDEIFRTFVYSYVSTFPLQRPSVIDKPAVTKYLINETGGVLGRVVNLLKNAAWWSIIDGAERIDLDILKKGREIPMKLER
ncbi:TniB family NTP-binding protein [Pseudomonas veronii]|uniref:TniB family NTP-binding protein n=1 Tax=Pseudomonas TaxID=286 RepID=UPI0018E6FCF2|nr:MULTISPECIES: TniB family NTP-binding protein [Pseudomonas]MBJ2180126.1 TniB family NTP-binding protein [Pseudomonas veronii]MDB1113919.1 TniB family NTP-binding protein [Pseudomonas extremaustralis]